MNVIIVGAGNVGYYLAERLSDKNYVVLIEKEPKLSEKVAEKLNCLVINGDGCNPEILKKAGIKKADVVAAVTGNDEDNLIICQIAKEIFNVKRVVARINNPKDEKTFYELGVDVAISGTSLLAKVIEEEVNWEDFVTLFTFKRGKLSILRIDLPETSPIINKKFKEIQLPEDSVIVAIIREDEFIIPKDEFVFLENDEVIAITKVENESLLLNSLIGEVEEK
ncbi:MAG: NAD-binding protein [Candidatus Omnitrophica bacterium]|nr:NAD-binding protein [Candidatus Omnitrophota bacterium]MCM8808552.1 NAD-binding protein [Candidatus Omnitrophota bacterium]MCM8810301.1 NAD-binding protein [Candidatus Omnitrophota bacterium]